MANLDLDLFASVLIREKVHSSESYAQNLYAALCNNEFIKTNEEYSKEKTWGCSWRTSGDIIATIIGDGDYLDWYCSGMQLDCDDYYLEIKKFVEEGTITEEIEKDLLSLGWQRL